MVPIFYIREYPVFTSIFSITSRASGRNTSPIILSTISLILYQCYCMKHLLELFRSSSLRTSVLIYLTTLQEQGLVPFCLQLAPGRAAQVICPHLILSVMRFGERILSVIIFVADVNNA